MIDTTRRVLNFASGGLMAAVALLQLTACGDPEASAVRAVAVSIAVTTAKAELVTVGDAVEASGVVEPWQRISPGTKLMGRISSVEVREGDPVRRGQLLAQLEDRDLQAAAEQARAGIAIAEAQLANSRAQYERMVQLREKGSVTAKNLEDATSAFRVAEASLQKSRADLSAAEAALDYARVISPIDGWVVDKRVEAGDMAAPGSPFFVLEKLDPVKIVVQVPEADVVGLEEGRAALVRISALDRSIEAEIDRVVPSGDPASRTFAVQVLVENPDGAIKSGMFARVSFSSGERDLLRVPQGATVHRGQMEGIFVVEDGSARLRWIKSGRSSDGWIEVISGLEVGESFIVEPPVRLRDGSPVSEG